MKITKIIIAIIVLFCACKKEPEFKGIKFGAIAPLTGDFARHGAYIKAGIEKAIEEINSKKELVRVYYEDACLGQDTVLALNNLINLKKVKAITGNYCVIGLSAISEEISKRKLITFQTSTLPESFENNNYVFSTFSNIQTEVQILTSLMTKNKHKKLGVIELKTPWGEEYYKNFKKEFAKKDIEVLSYESYPISYNDYRSQITKLKSKNLDALVVIHVDAALDQIIKELKTQGVNLPIYGVQESYDPELFLKFNYKGKFNLVLPFKPGKLHPLSMHAYKNTKLLYSTMTGCKFNESCIQSNLEKKVGKNSYSDYVIVELFNGQLTLR